MISTFPNTNTSIDISDALISSEEFIEYKKSQYELFEGTTMPEEELDFVRSQYKLMDIDGDGKLTWWEFMKFEARKYIARREEVCDCNTSEFILV